MKTVERQRYEIDQRRGMMVTRKLGIDNKKELMGESEKVAGQEDTK